MTWPNNIGCIDAESTTHSSNLPHLNLRPSGVSIRQIFGDYLVMRHSAPQCAQDSREFRNRAKNANKPLKASGLSG